VRAANAAAALGNIGTELGRQQAATAAAEAGKAQVNVNVNSGTSSETPRSVPAGRSDLDVGSDRYNAGDFMGAYAKWRDASDQGDTRAMRSIGWLYEKGQGVQQNYAEAMRWFRKAADGGDVDAMYRLGNCYADGHGVQQDLAEAKRWWSKAAEGGSTKAKERLKELQ
jgi:TPR repeat protein